MKDIFYINKDGDIVNVSDIASICRNNVGKSSYTVSFKSSKHSLYCTPADYDAIKTLICNEGNLYDDERVNFIKQATQKID